MRIVHVLERVIKYVCLLYIPYVWQDCVLVTTEHTEWQCPLSGDDFSIMVKSAQSVEWGGCTTIPFHAIYHHEQSYGVRSSWEGKYTPPLPLNVIRDANVESGRATNLSTHSSKISIHKNPQKSLWFTLYRGGGGGRYSTVYLLAVQIPAVPNNWVKLRIKDSCCGKLLLLLSPAHFCTGIGFKYILYVYTYIVFTGIYIYIQSWICLLLSASCMSR